MCWCSINEVRSVDAVAVRANDLGTSGLLHPFKSSSPLVSCVIGKGNRFGRRWCNHLSECSASYLRPLIQGAHRIDGCRCLRSFRIKERLAFRNIPGEAVRGLFPSMKLLLLHAGHRHQDNETRCN